MSIVLIPAERLLRWVQNFESRHGTTRLAVLDGALCGTADDGSTFRARLPFDKSYAGAPNAVDLGKAVTLPADWGILLVRKGGFAIARLHEVDVATSKVGQRHVQGRTKAGGQSQQRFARRRDNQARQAFEAAADHAARILVGVPLIVVGGDRGAVEEVLADPRLAGIRVVGPWLPVPDPRRAVLTSAIADAQSIAIEVTNT